MSKISYFAIISLLCLFSLSTLTSASRRLTGVVVNQEMPQNTTFQDPIKKMEKSVKGDERRTTNINPSQVTPTKLGNEQGVKTMQKERKTKLKKEKHNDKAEHDTKKVRRQDGATGAYTRDSTKLAKRKTPRVVLWRVPRPKNEMPQTGFNLDYAPPKVHPPTHN